MLAGDNLGNSADAGLSVSDGKKLTDISPPFLPRQVSEKMISKSQTKIENITEQ